MSDSHDDTVQRLLKELRAGDRRAFDDLFPLVYEELRRAVFPPLPPLTIHLGHPFISGTLEGSPRGSVSTSAWAATM